MSTLICPVTRNVATDTGPQALLGELHNWNGVALFVHRHINAGRILGTPEWTCSHERTGYAIAHGPSPDAALFNAADKLRTNGLLILRKITCKLPVLNP